MSDPILIARDLRKLYGSLEAVKEVSFSVERGEIFSLLGPNGAGKTTTISMLSCLLAPSGGEAEIGGFSITRDALAVKRLIGVVPQELALYGPLSARQNLQFWGRMHSMGGRELHERIEEVLEQVGLADRAGDRVEKYSGGMKRRLNLATGLLHRPQLVFMDEPTVGIDPHSRRRILDLIKELRAQGMTVLYTTHYMEEAAELSDRIGIIDHGSLIALGTLKELVRLAGTQETLRLHFSEVQPGDDLARVFQDVEGVLQAGATDSQVVLAVSEAHAVLPGVIAAAHLEGLRIRSVDIEEPNLESVFLHLTGRALRD
jgi:ABC-2 type transport system ATP-binding protein